MIGWVLLCPDILLEHAHSPCIQLPSPQKRVPLHQVCTKAQKQKRKRKERKGDELMWEEVCFNSYLSSGNGKNDTSSDNDIVYFDEASLLSPVNEKEGRLTKQGLYTSFSFYCSLLTIRDITSQAQKLNHGKNGILNFVRKAILFIPKQRM